MSIIQHYIKLHSVYKYANRFFPVSSMEEAINLSKQNYIKAEIIGQWLYCFTNHLIGEQLLAAGFWYSLKHNAYVYSGSPKINMADDESLNEIRFRLGSYHISQSIAEKLAA